MAVCWELPASLHKAASHLGNLSYPIYVLHVPLLFLAGPAKAVAGSSAGGVALYVATVTLLAVPAASADRARRDWVKRQTRPVALT